MLLLQFSSSSESSKPFPAKLWLGCACCPSLPDAFVWLLAYEISLISLCTAFSLEGRSVSKNFCFRNHAGIVANFNRNVRAALLNCPSSAGSANSLGHTDVAISLNWFCWRWRWSKRQRIRFGLTSSGPCRRLRVWIYCLAAFAMKFSFALVLLFLLFAFSSDYVGVATWLRLGYTVGTFSVAAYSDFKQISAALSILHMCFALFLSPMVQPT